MTILKIFNQAFLMDCSVSSDLSSVGLRSGDSAVVSAENFPLVALTSGRVAEVGKAFLTLHVDKWDYIYLHFQEIYSRSVMSSSISRDLRNLRCDDDVIFRVDKCDWFNSLSSCFANLSQLMCDCAISAKLRELIVDKRAPEFELTIAKARISQGSTVQYAFCPNSMQPLSVYFSAVIFLWSEQASEERVTEGLDGERLRSDQGLSGNRFLKNNFHDHFQLSQWLIRICLILT